MDLTLDPQIVHWVTLPILGIMFVVGLVRILVQQLLAPSRQTPPGVAAGMAALGASRRAALVAPRALASRGALAMAVGAAGPRLDGVATALEAASKASGGDAAMVAGDPSAMTDMLKGSMGQMIPQVVLGGGVSYFFSGFLVGRLPFPLTVGFRGMVQRGLRDMAGPASLSMACVPPSQVLGWGVALTLSISCSFPTQGTCCDVPYLES